MRTGKRLRNICGAVLAVELCLLLAPQALASDLMQAHIVTAPRATPQARAAVTLLREEVARRTGAAPGGSGQRSGERLVLARRGEVVHLLPRRERAAWARKLSHLATPKAEAYTIATIGQSLVVAGDDDRGILFGAGYLLRKAEMSPGQAILPDGLDIHAAPQLAWRAHQIGYRFKNNSYDAFTAAMFEQQVRDLAVFGANGIQWIAPVSDDQKASPLFHADPLDMAVTVSGIMDRYGLDFDLYYPQMGDDYADPATRAAELRRFETLVKRLPRIDALYVPGGDPGHTAPDLLFPLVADETAILHRYHPGATIWISGQGFDAAQYARFYALLAAQPRWLTGVFFGPQSRDAAEVQRAHIPKRYPLLFYPDIAHTMHAQFPVPQWDPAFALTEGREPVNPQPRTQGYIFRHFAPQFAGYVTYSEGVNDDVNKTLWSALGWNGDTDTADILADYGRYFLGDAALGEDLAALERNWDGPVAANSGIEPTLRRFEGEAFRHAGNWRFDMAVYRATYDAYVRRRSIAERAREKAAWAAIGAGKPEAARQALDSADSADTGRLRARLYELAGQLFRETGLQLSVKLYGASGVERGANLDRVDVSLNDRVWLEGEIGRIQAITDPSLRAAELKRFNVAELPVSGGFYDDLGDPQNEPHLVHGLGFNSDPELYNSAIDGIADMTPDQGWRMAWVTYAETLYETPLTLHYDGLNPARPYRLKIVYAGEAYALPIRLTANDVVLHDFTERTANPMTVEIDVPPGLTHGGALTLQWTRPPGLGGSGRGHQLAQVWLYPQDMPAK